MYETDPVETAAMSISSARTRRSRLIAMAYAEKRGSTWRARWRAPDGTLESRPGFLTRKEAENYGHDQEAAIRSNTSRRPTCGPDNSDGMGE